MDKHPLRTQTGTMQADCQNQQMKAMEIIYIYLKKKDLHRHYNGLDGAIPGCQLTRKIISHTHFIWPSWLQDRS
jgi:hypothetical protein